MRWWWCKSCYYCCRIDVTLLPKSKVNLPFKTPTLQKEHLEAAMKILEEITTKVVEYEGESYDFEAIGTKAGGSCISHSYGVCSCLMSSILKQWTTPPLRMELPMTEAAVESEPAKERQRTLAGGRSTRIRTRTGHRDGRSTQHLKLSFKEKDVTFIVRSIVIVGSISVGPGISIIGNEWFCRKSKKKRNFYHWKEIQVKEKENLNDNYNDEEEKTLYEPNMTTKMMTANTADTSDRFQPNATVRYTSDENGFYNGNNNSHSNNQDTTGGGDDGDDNFSLYGLRRRNLQNCLMSSMLCSASNRNDTKA